MDSKTMKTVYAVHDDEASAERGLTAFGKSGIAGRHMRILGLHDTQAAFNARKAGVSANVVLGLAAAPHEAAGRKERVRHLLEDMGLKGEEYEALIHAIDRGQTVLAVDVPKEDADRARAILSLEQRS